MSLVIQALAAVTIWVSALLYFQEMYVLGLPLERSRTIILAIECLGVLYLPIITYRVFTKGTPE